MPATTPIGRIVLGDGIAADGSSQPSSRLCVRGGRSSSASRAPGLPWASGSRPGSASAAGRSNRSCCRRAKRPSGWRSSRTRPAQLAALRVERREPLVAIGGGALGDAAGFLAATYLRGVPFVQVPTTLVAQIDSSIGGKTGVDLPEGKNLLGAFHQPSAVIIDVALLRTLPERQLRAALGEAVKMAALGDERLFELLEARRDRRSRVATPAAFESGAVAEVVERAGWAKVEVVVADERERDAAGGRITLNLGHSLGHAVEAAAGYGDLLHGEAVAYGLRAACRIGARGRRDAAGAGRADRGAARPRSGLATEPLPYSLDAVLGHLATDKKHAAGRLRWVLPTADGVVVRTDVARRRSSTRRRRGRAARRGAPRDDRASSSSRARTSTCSGRASPRSTGANRSTTSTRGSPPGPPSSVSTSPSSSRTTRARSSTGSTCATSMSRSSTPAG